MSASQSLHQYYMHQLQLIERCYEGCLRCSDPELVHQLRLCIKKIKALDILAGFLLPLGMSIDRHFEKDLKRLFKISGELRDTQVQIQLLSSFEAKEGHCFPEYRAWLVKREKKRISRFGEEKEHPENLMEQITLHETGNILAQADDDAIQESAGEALVGLYAKVQDLLTGSISDNNLHKLRTVTKQMRYIYNMVKHSYPGFEFDKISVDALREIEAAAGHWHDCLVRVELFARFGTRLKDDDHDTLLKYQSLTGLFKAELDEAYHQACKVSKKEFCR